MIVSPFKVRRESKEARIRRQKAAARPGPNARRYAKHSLGGRRIVAVSSGQGEPPGATHLKHPMRDGSYYVQYTDGSWHGPYAGGEA